MVFLQPLLVALAQFRANQCPHLTCETSASRSCYDLPWVFISRKQDIFSIAQQMVHTLRPNLLSNEFEVERRPTKKWNRRPIPVFVPEDYFCTTPREAPVHCTEKRPFYKEQKVLFKKVIKLPSSEFPRSSFNVV